MKTLKFLAVAILLVAFFAVGCASTSGGDGEMSKFRKLLRDDINGAVVPLRNDVAMLKARPDPDLGPVKQQLAELSARVGTTEASLVNLQQSVTVAVQTADAAVKDAKRSAETSDAALKTAVGANKKATKALKLVSQEVISPEAAARIDRELSGRPASTPAGSSSGVVDSINGDGRFYMPLRTGSSEISEENKLALIAFMEREHLKIKEVIAAKDRKPPKGKDEDESNALNQALADKRGAKAIAIFNKWLLTGVTVRVIDPPSERPKFPGGLIFILGK